MSSQHPKSEFTDVDKADMPEGYIQLLDVQRDMEFVQQYKQRARTLLRLQAGLEVLDAGAGTGEDAQAMAALVAPMGHVVGLDFSQAMVNVAQQRSHGMNLPLNFVQGDIHHLPFADNSFDRCYADKTFQHLPDPKLALSELVRVLKPGGLLVIVDGDHETQVLDVPYPDVTRRFLRFRNDGMRQPDISHRLYGYFKDASLLDISIEPMVRVTTDYETIRPVSRFVEGMQTAQHYSIVTAEESERWIAAFEETVHTDHFFYAITWFITSGRKPI